MRRRVTRFLAGPARSIWSWWSREAGPMWFVFVARNRQASPGAALWPVAEVGPSWAGGTTERPSGEIRDETPEPVGAESALTLTLGKKPRRAWSV